jgi:hypothetical protein
VPSSGFERSPGTPSIDYLELLRVVGSEQFAQDG